jgi:predicted dehydrogenase
MSGPRRASRVRPGLEDFSMSDRVKIGVIGVGQIGKAHLRSYAGIPEAEVVAVADINLAEAQRVAGEFKIADAYNDFRALLKRPDITAVDVCLHNNFHMPVTVEALRAGKHVYCEKPMAGSLADADTMYRISRECGKKLSIQLSTVFSKETRAAKELIDGGHLGKVYHGRSTGHRRRGRPFVDGYGSPTFVQKQNSAGGALYDMGVYHIAEMMFLLGNPEVKRISGQIYQEVAMDAKRRESSGYNVEELGMGFVKCAGGITVDIVESWAINLDTIEGSTVVGSQAGLRLRPFGFFQSLGHLDLNATTNLDGAAFRWSNVACDGGVYNSPQHHWVAALQDRVPLLPTAELALNTMLISEGIYLSSKLEREVSAAEVREHSKSTAVKV